MRRLTILAAGAIALAAPSIAHADSMNFGMGFHPQNRGGGVAGFNLGYSTGNRGGYGGYGYGGGGGYYGGAPVVLVPVQPPTRTIIAVCDRGGVLGSDGRCHVHRRVR